MYSTYSREEMLKRVVGGKSGFDVNEFMYSDNVTRCGRDLRQSDCNSKLHCVGHVQGT